MSNKLTLECNSFTASARPDGRMVIELIDCIATEPVPPPASQRWSKVEAAERLTQMMGQPVSAKSVERWSVLKKHPLPFHKPGGRVVFVERELQDWVASGGVHPQTFAV